MALVVLAGCRTVLTWGWTVVLLGAGAARDRCRWRSPATRPRAGRTTSPPTACVLHVRRRGAVGGRAGRGARARPPSAEPDRASALATAVPRFSAAGAGLLARAGGHRCGERAGPGAARRRWSHRATARWCSARSRALVALGVLGLPHRRRSVGRAAAGASRGRCCGSAASRSLLMLATIGLAVALGRSAPPDAGVGLPSRTEVLLGYDLAGPPTLARLLFDWRFDLIFGIGGDRRWPCSTCIGVRRLRRRGDAWPVGRTVAWLAGCAGAAGRDELGDRPVRAGDVQRAHGRAHDARRCWCRSCWCSARR